MDQDQLSNLPRIILHDILSKLPDKEAARTSVLSKAWAETYSTFPILYFSDTKIVGTFPQPMVDFYRKRRVFVEYVTKTVQRFHDQGLAIKEFKLILNSIDLDYTSRDLDDWLKLLAGEVRVEALELVLPDKDWEGQECCYVLPTGVLEAKSLNKLVLMGGIRVDQEFVNRSIKVFSLRELALWNVLVGDEQGIEHIISQFPSIESVTLKGCSVSNPGGAGGLLEPRNHRMKSLRMRGLPNLKEVDIQGIEEVYIDAPSLEKLCYCPGDLHAPFKLNFDRCTNLRGLHLWAFKGTIVTQKWFTELFHKFPLLENLKLDSCIMSEKIYISSDKLKVLLLANCSNLKEVIIDAPDLSLCQYCGGGAPKPIISFLRSSSRLKANVQMYLDHLDLSDLREFIQNMNPQNVLASLSLFIHQPSADVADPVVLHDSSSPPIIKNLDLRSAPKNETFFWLVVNSLLSSCCPETISFSLHDFFCSRAFIEFFYETLMGSKENECFCSSGRAKCWWHGLKGVKVTNTRNTEMNADFKTMLDALPTWAIHDNFIFMLEW